MAWRNWPDPASSVNSNAVDVQPRTGIRARSYHVYRPDTCPAVCTLGQGHTERPPYASHDGARLQPVACFITCPAQNGTTTPPGSHLQPGNSLSASSRGPPGWDITLRALLPQSCETPHCRETHKAYQRQRGPKRNRLPMSARCGTGSVRRCGTSANLRVGVRW